MSKSRGFHKLSSTFVHQHKKPGNYEDGRGLRFRIQPNGTKSWIMRVTHAQKRHDVYLGTYPALPLLAARERAEQIRANVSACLNPSARTATRSQEMCGADATVTFEDVWQQFWIAKEPNLSNRKHRAQWVSTMDAYVLPWIGKHSVAAITPSEIRELLTPIWKTKEETARRVLSRIRAVFDLAVVDGLRQNPNPCTGVSNVLGHRRVMDKRHHSALPYGDAPEFMCRIGQRRGHWSVGLAIQFAVLTAARSGEARYSTWDEIDFDNRLWTIPARRMKARKIHVVPLTDQAIGILDSAHVAGGRQLGLIFPGPSGKALSDMSLTQAIRRLGLEDRPTLHGFRSTFKDWAAENGIADDVSEAALAHGEKDDTKAAYKRTTFLKKRVVAMQDWADFLCQPRRKPEVNATTQQTSSVDNPFRR